MPIQRLYFPGREGRRIVITALGRTEDIATYATEAMPTQTLSADAGRVARFDGALAGITSAPVVVQSDGKSVLDLRALSDAATLSATINGDPVSISVAPRAQQRGMASGLFYWLAQEADGRFKIEPGRRHRKVYVSGSASAKTRAMIAAEAGVAETTVTGAWLAARPQYGGSTADVLAMDTFNLLKGVLYGGTKDSRSDWLFFERGYSYDFGLPLNTKGESELHPLVVDAWGTGARPYFTNGMFWTKPTGRFIAFKNLRIKLLKPWYSYGLIFENCQVRDEIDDVYIGQSGMNTLRECVIHDLRKLVPKAAGATVWAPHEDRTSGMYLDQFYNIMIDSCLVDHNGWGDGYDFNLSANFPLPPSMYSHGIYAQYQGRNLHIRDGLFSNNASQGIQTRVGGQIERNLLLDNNIATGLQSGSNMGTIHQFINAIDLVAFGAGYRRASAQTGGYNHGIGQSGKMSAMHGCIVAHLANPDDAAEVSARPVGGKPYDERSDYTVNDTQVFNWADRPDERVTGLDRTMLMQTTIQRFAATKLAQPTASINDLVYYLMDATENQIGKTVREAIQWTKARFGRPILDRTTPANLVFRPDPRTDGFRWDNRLNWSTQDLPGLNSGDGVDLDGHSPLFGTLNTSIAMLTSKSGSLDITSGRLTLGGLGDALDATVRLSGQLWLGATTHPASIRANGGRVNLTGTVSDLALEARGNAEVLFGANATVPAGKALVLSGQRVMAGWDGTGDATTGSATLTVAGTLEFRAGIAIATGIYGNQHFVDLGRRIQTATASALIADFEERGSSQDRFWLSDLTGTPQPEETFVYGTALNTNNTVNEDIDKIATVGSVLSAGIPMLQRFRSGAIGDGLTEPTVAASLVLAAGSQIVITRRDLLAPGTYDLTGPGVTVTDQGATLPAGVSVTGGKLVLTV